ncbi:MAG TPA: alpha/beta fold hydrolase [Gemmatimonadaceae bacterium]|nr:alpha/beta fold hydrolase [Gemmatimonadaceae bacterium]
MPDAPVGVVRRGCEDIRLEAPGDSAVLLLHGFGDTPQTLSYLAPGLNRAGFTVYAPLLPGHGRSVADFSRSSAEDWLDASREALRELSASHSSVGLCGLSMGGALAILLAAEHRELRALALIAPYVTMPARLVAAAASHRLWGPLLGVIGASDERSIRDVVERERNLGYAQTTGRLLNDLWRLGRRARTAVPEVKVPTLVIQSREDNRIRPRVAERLVRRLGATEKRLVFTQGAGHIITVDHGRDAVIAEVRDWFAAHLGSR